ncbi:MAG TPA: thiamine phosphate synthase [Candidatus Faecimorpha stercoravium]|nr:thiamine phosphate synthase [Candidatus Faecimorpha stercoravium]
MKSGNSLFTLYAVTDRTWLGGASLSWAVKEALTGGITLLQLREKNLTDREMLQEAQELLPLCHRHGVPLIINDRVQVALDAGADGVHLGQEDMSPREARAILGPDAIIGVSARTVGSAQRAEQEGADYLGVGAVFSTSTKKDAQNISPETLRQICQAVHIPVVAIGGIGPDNILELLGCGIQGVAVVSSIFAQKNIAQAASRLRALSEQIIVQK